MFYDKHIRHALVEGFCRTPAFVEEETYVIEEFDLCGGISRIDVALVNGMLHGFEIKSDRDNLERLARQQEDYNRVFNTVTVVTTKAHLSNVEDLIPAWWGLIELSENKGRTSISLVRKPGLNPGVDGFHVAMLLWREELLVLLREKAGITAGVKSKTRRALARLACEKIPLADIESYVRTALKSRPAWKARRLPQRCDG